MFQKVDEPAFVAGEHEVLRFWREADVFGKLQRQNAGKPKWSFLDGPITANNPMGVHHAWGRTYKDAFQRYFAMTGRELRYQNGFDCQGLWVEVEVEKELKLGTKTGIADYGIDRFVWECKKRVLKFAARQTEQSVRLGYWMEWDDPEELRKLAAAIGTEPISRDPQGSASGSPLTAHHSPPHTYVTARGQTVTEPAEQIVAKLGNPEWGGSYFTFSTENNETIWTFLKKCFERKKIYMGHDVMPWSGRAGSAYSQMEVADGRKLTTHRSCFVRFPLLRERGGEGETEGGGEREYLLVWTTTPWTLTSNVACAVNPELEYVRLRAKKDGAVYYFAKDNLESKRLEKEFKEGFGRPEWSWPEGVGKLKSIAQLFKEQGGYEIEGTIKGAEMVGWRYAGPFDDLPAQNRRRMEREEDLNTDIPDPTTFTIDADPAYYDPSRNPQSKIDREHDRLIADCRERYAIRRENPKSDTPELSSKEASRIAEIEAERRREHRAALMGQVASHRHRLHEYLNYGIGTGLIEAEVGGLAGDVPPIESFRDVEVLLRSLGCADAIGNEHWQHLLNAEDLSERWRLGGEDAFHEEADGLPPAYLLQLAEAHRHVLESIQAGLREAALDSGAQSHRVINGGRDNKGNPIVLAGEGTGIVHIAPGCGDVDRIIGKRFNLPTIAPLMEDGTFDEGYGVFTAREAIDSKTADLVFDELKKKGLLVYVETYPHIYPHCWRTGDELVFRLVDEWFINMDWREEIKEVARAIEWLPPEIEGREREVEWLSNMRDWMISKKRFWGLALPIWVNTDDPGDFEVIGSLAELKERALNGGEGWEEFDGHTPHRPWIDVVKIPSRKHEGQLLSRIVDVGNPWLDAGIVPFSTLNYNERYPTEACNWEDWYPPHFVVECFPGQFRNWFYSLLALSTMMRWDPEGNRTPEEKRPFKTLLGHRLVMNEDGKPMHKSDGTAIWFEEAAEQLGVDTLRWMYLAQNPAQDLRFGTRHPDQPVTLQTPEGPISHTKEGLPCAKVTSKPADEVRRMVLLPLWNSYSFFVNYARLDGFDPAQPQVPVSERPEIDRWILSNLQAFLQTANERFAAFDAAEVCGSAAAFIDDLSNWYIRRNRRRFWRSRAEQGAGSGEQRAASFSRDPQGSAPVANAPHSPVTTHHSPAAGWDPDKLAAYQTLYEVLVTLTKALAPVVPFLCERMYGNLVRGQGGGGRGQEKESVHLCAYPQPDSGLLKPELNRRTALAQRIVRMGHRLREEANQRVRQPLAELKYACASEQDAADIAAFADVIADELNVKRLSRAKHLDELVHYTYKPNLKTLGPKYGKLLGEIRTLLAGAESREQRAEGTGGEQASASAQPSTLSSQLAALRRGKTVTITLPNGEPIVLAPEDVLVTTEQAADWAVADEPGIQIALSTILTPELNQEGMARDFVRHVQQARKDAGLEITDRIRIGYTAGDEVAAAVEAWREYIARETLADAIERGAAPADAKSVQVGDAECRVGIERV